MTMNHYEGRGYSRYRPFPVLTRPENEAEGYAILREIPGPVGVLLFSALRDVMLWLEVPDIERATAFRPGAAEVRRRAINESSSPTEVRVPLITLVTIIEEGTFVASKIVEASSAIADWATQNNYPYTELAFTQAVALTDPHSLRAALITARLARELSEFPRAETWYRHTIKRARVTKDWSIYIDAILGLGNFYIRTGNHPVARLIFEHALKGAQRWKLRKLEGAAHHDLFHLSAEAGHYRAAYEHAKAAREAYGSDDNYLTRLAADVAFFSAQLGCYERATMIFRVLVSKAPSVNLRALWTANLVRAAAHAGFRAEYELMRPEALDAVHSASHPVRVVEGHILLAQADFAMGEWERARDMAETARSRAAAIGTAELQFQSEEILSLIDTGVSKVATIEPKETPGLTRFADTIARELILSVVS